MKIRKLSAALLLVAAALPVRAVNPVSANFSMVSDERIMCDTDVDDDMTIAGMPMKNVRVRVSLVRPVDLGGHDLSPLVAALDSVAGVRISQSGALSVDSWKSLVAAPASAADAGYGQWLTVRSALVCLDRGLAVWRIDREMYTGGAHGMYSTDFVNYAVADGNVLAFGDVFTDGSKPALRKAIRKWISDSEYAETVASYDDSGLGSVDVPSVFYFDGQGKVWFVYQPYEIAPYSSGMIFVPLNVWEIGPALTPYAHRLLGVSSEE